jgi:2-dehydropantoate 2-reductase
MKRCRVLLAGAGALGSLFGGLLRRAGHDVTLFGRSAHLDAIRRGPLRIGGIWGEMEASDFRIATNGSEAKGPFDLVIVAVKSYDTSVIASEIAGSVADGGHVLTLQNGLGNLETLATVFDASLLLAAPVLIGAEIPEPGAVRVTVYAKPVKIGAFSGAEAAASRYAAILSEAGIPAEPTDRLFAFLWEKVLYNAPLNPLGALLRVPYGALARHPESRAIMDEVMEEGFSVAVAAGVDLLWNDLAECRRHFYEVLLPPTAHHRSSMLQDLEKGRRTEIDAINGYIAGRGGALGIPTPANALLTRLVKFAGSG